SAKVRRYEIQGASETDGQFNDACRVRIVSPGYFDPAIARGRVFWRATPRSAVARIDSFATARRVAESRAGVAPDFLLVASAALAGQRAHPPGARRSRGRRGDA